MAKGCGFVPRSEFLPTLSDSSKLKGSHVWYKDKDCRWSFWIIHTVGSASEPFAVRFSDDPGSVKIVLHPELYSTDAATARFSCNSASSAVSREEGILDGVRHATHVLI